MTRILAEFALDARGLTYLKEQLADAKSLGAALLEIADLGEAFTQAPADTAEAQIYAFEHGGLLPENLNMANAISTEGGVLVPIIGLGDERTLLIADAMSALPGSICLANDVNPTWTPVQNDDSPTAFGVNDEVYHVANPGASLVEIEDALIGLLPWHGVTAVCREPLALSDSREATLSALRQSALSATLITCSAYDGEGFVAWRRKS